MLRDAGLVESEKWRYWTYYRLPPERVADAQRPARDARRPGAVRRQPSDGRAADATDTALAASLAEVVGTAFLVAVVVGSGIAAQRLSPDDVGLAAARELHRDRAAGSSR